MSRKKQLFKLFSLYLKKKIRQFSRKLPGLKLATKTFEGLRKVLNGYLNLTGLYNICYLRECKL